MGYDAFLVAFRIPNFTRRLFAEGAFSQAFVPVLSEYRATRGEVEVKHLIDHVAGSLGVVLMAVSVIGIVAAPLIIGLFAPGFHHDPRFEMATQMLQITFSYVMLISLTAFAGGILNTYGRFSLPAITPIVLNLAMIACALLFSAYCEPSVKALAWGVLFGGILQFLIQIPVLRRLKLCPRPRLNWADPGVKRILTLMVPALFGASVGQINLMIDSIFASWLAVGSVSWLYYADRLLEFPLGIFGVAIATVILPHLSAKHARQSHQEFSWTVDWAFRWIVVIGVPATVGLGMLAQVLVLTLFRYGHYTEHDALMTSRAAVAMAVGLMAFLLIKVLVSAFYAKQDTKYPVKVGVWILIFNVVLSLLFIKPLAHVGLALASSLAGIMNAGFLFAELWRRKVYRPRAGWVLLLIRIMLASGLMGAFLWLTMPVHTVLLAQAFWLRLLWVGGLVCASGVVYVASLLLVGVRRVHFRQWSTTE